MSFTFPQHYELYSGILVIVLLIIWIIRLEFRIHKLLIGKNSETLDESINTLKKRIDILKIFRDDTERKIDNMNQRISKSITGVDLKRFNAFKGTGEGGEQSFATALVNEQGDGIVISSIYSRDRISIFGKPIKANTSSLELSEEEKSVLQKASQNTRV